MPQELRIVKCFKCVTYQVDIVKKAKKWSCKMCGEKQTLKQEFGRSSGPECRKMVQQLNMKKHEFEQMAHDVVQKIVNEEIEMPEFLLEQSRPEDGIPEPKQGNQPKSSKWDTFAESSDSEEELDCENLLEHKAQLSASFKPRVYKRKSLCSPEITESPEEPAHSQTKSSFFNFNKKSKFQFDSPNTATQDSIKKPKIDPKPKMNSNSKWGNFLNNSDEEGDD